MANGFLEYLMNPASQGMLNLSAGLLQAGGPSRTPVGFGQALGQGMQQGAQGIQQAQQQQLQQQLLQAKMAELQRQGNAPINVSPGGVVLDPITKQPIFQAPFAPRNAEEPRAPTTRKIKIGTDEVTQEFDPMTKTWKEVGRGPAHSDKPLVRVEVGEKGDKKYIETRMTGEAQEVAKLYSSADSALRNNGALDRIAKHSDEAFAGAAAPIMAAATNLLSSFGYDAKALTSTAQVDQAISEMLANRMGELGARGLTDKDMEVLRSNLPKVNQSRDARVAVVSVLKKANNATITEAQERRRMELEQYPDLKGRTRNYTWEKYKPVEEAPSAPTPSPQAAPSAPKAGDVVDGWEFRGGNPSDRMNWRKK
jgi:hypothetical protein